MTNKKNKYPITVVTGFLGSGKTTLLAKALKTEEMNNTAVLVNEFGKVGLDHHLLETVEENTILLGGGCVCCSTREDLVKGLSELLNRRARTNGGDFDRVVIETTGLADPSPIAFTILTHPLLQHHFYVENVIVTVDAVNGQLHLDNQQESTKQVAIADKIVITKMDIATEKQAKELETRIRLINPTAELIRTEHGQVDPNFLLKSVEFTKIERLKDNELDSPSHVKPTRSISISFEKPLDWTTFGLWLSMLLHARGEQMLRVKGMLNVGEKGPILLNGVQHIIHPPEHLQEWPTKDTRSRIVFIMQSIEPESVLESLNAFQDVLGAEANLIEMEVLV